MKAVVVGGGIGGLTAAIALRRTGHEVTVLERAPELREIGAGLSLAPNAMRALDALGIGERVRTHSAPSEVSGTLRTSSGRFLRRFRPGRDEPLAAFHRAELHSALLAELPETVVQTGIDVTDAAEADADVIVAADGVHSGFRHWLFPAAPGPGFRYTAWRGVTEPGVGPPVRGSFTMGRGAYFMIHPLPGARACWALGAAEPTPGVRNPSEHAEVARRIADWPAEARELVAATRPDAVLHNDILDLDPLPASRATASRCSVTRLTPCRRTSARARARRSRTPWCSPSRCGTTPCPKRWPRTTPRADRVRRTSRSRRAARRRPTRRRRGGCTRCWR
ncbi:FAD-dependent monooxygenase [Amycolatopsis carbonis]|uniref:FAD-dependent monooxygenase n=1 Tax=Amycolatopsis carbonis TaxID=715471 RepID=A0A9Y2MRK1_9PSEU|nr:FAD-dependent monooxygenase [Amycolatopsis sp. 2-15]WIX78550.1 FAD-dependent monooxygenase [Amycolatopsis sp. 2-15]